MKPRVAFDSANAFNKPIDFEIEVAVDDEVKQDGVGKEAIGGDGRVSQFTLQYILETIDLRFNWMSPDIKQQVVFWMLNFGVIGDAFRYFPDQTDLTRYYDMKLPKNTKVADIKRAHPRLEEFDITFNKCRIVNISAQIETDRLGFYP